MKTIYEERPWGHFERFTLNEQSTVKLIYLNKGHRLSYQYHDHRSEFWRVVKGKIKITLNGKAKILSEGDTTLITKKMKHRMEGLKDSIILEIARGHFNEKDNVRLLDDYSRAKK